MSDNNIDDGYGKIDDEEKNDNLSAIDDYFQMQEEAEKVIPITPDIDINDSMADHLIKQASSENKQNASDLQSLSLDTFDDIMQSAYGAGDSQRSPEEKKLLDAIVTQKKHKLITEGWDLDSMSIPDEWFEKDPPPKKYLISGFIPEGVVGVLGARGGTGKSMLALQLCILYAGAYGGGEFFGMDIDKNNRGKALFLSAEDDRDECWERFNNMRAQMDKSDVVMDWKDVQKNLMIKSLVGKDFRFTKSDGGSAATPVHETLEIVCSTMRTLQNVKLVIIDTYSRFNGGAENSNEDSAAFVRACERIRVETGATVLILAHVNKSAGRDITGVSGGGRFIDSARWAAMITPYLYDSEDHKKMDMDDEEALKHLEFRVGKDNYSGNLGKSIYMKRTENGILTAHVKVKAEKGKPGPKAQYDYDPLNDPAYQNIRVAIVDIIGKHERDDKALTLTKFTGQYSGQKYGLGVGEKKLRQFVRAAITEGIIREKSLSHPTRSVLVLP